jgi:CRISPR-associated Csx2 family protein
MSKVIISFLGTGGYSDRESKCRGEYRETTYLIDNKNYVNSFVSDVLLKHYKAEKVIYIGTLKSMWDVVYDTYVDAPNDEVWEGLADSINLFNHTTDLSKGENIIKSFDKTMISPILIKYGLNKQENEENIKQLFEIEKLINNGDEIFIDITHGFRSMPIVLVGVLNFIIEHLKKNIKIAKISYGMFEVSHEMGGNTPIVDLDVLLELQENTKASHEFSEYGNAYIYSNLLKEVDASMSSVLLDMSYAKSLNHLKKLKGLISQLQGFKYDNLSEIQKLTIPRIVENFLIRFRKSVNDSHFQFEIAQWMYDNKQFGYSYIILTESIISKMVEKLSETGNSEFTSIKEVKKKRDFAKANLDYSIKSIYRKVNTRRISVAHAKESGKSIRESVNELKQALKDVKEFIY